MSEPTKNEYREVVHYIKSHFGEIRQRALEVIERDHIMEELNERLTKFYAEFLDDIGTERERYWELIDTWDSYGDSVDFNIVNDGGYRLRCIAYPVINDNTCYDSDMATEIPL